MSAITKQVGIYVQTSATDVDNFSELTCDQKAIGSSSTPQVETACISPSLACWIGCWSKEPSQQQLHLQAGSKQTPCKGNIKFASLVIIQQLCTADERTSTWAVSCLAIGGENGNNANREIMHHH